MSLQTEREETLTSDNIMSGAIPISARDKADGWFPNPRDLSTTPGGTIYATTPGGSRIVYDREALLKYRESPLAKTPTKVLPVIPGVTAPDDHEFLKPQQSPKILVSQSEVLYGHANISDIEDLKCSLTEDIDL